MGVFLLIIALSMHNDFSFYHNTLVSTPNQLISVPVSSFTEQIMVHNNMSDNNNQMLEADLFVHLLGELGNNLLAIAYGKIIQLFALEDGRFNFTIRYLWNSGQTKVTDEEVQKCFSKHFSKGAVNLTELQTGTPHWEKKLKTQNDRIASLFADWKNSMHAAEMITFTGNTTESIQLSLDHLANITRRMLYHHQNQSMSLPFVITTAFANIPLIDRYYNELHELFTFNESQCCRDCPDADETVLHIRGFEVESQEVSNMYGFHDLDVYQAAHELLGHLRVGDKVTITRRFEEKDLANYTGILREHGLQARFVTGHTGPQGFCFLKCTTKGLYGDYFSTYFRTAALFSDTVKNVTFYNNNRLGDMRSRAPAFINITNPNLARKKKQLSYV